MILREHYSYEMGLKFLYIARHIRNGLEKDQLDLADWKVFQDMVNILEHFYRCTLELEAMMRYMFFFLLWTFFSSIVELQKICIPITNLVYSLRIAVHQLNKYYTLTDSNTVLYAAVALHPSMKFDYF